MSTAAIGKRMKMDKYMPGISVLAENVESSASRRRTRRRRPSARRISFVRRWPSSWRLAVNRMMGGMAKGSGMIHPNMATMLGVVTCDAAVSSSDVWRDITSRAGSASFNQISVDGDTSTNDSLVCFASGEAQRRNRRRERRRGQASGRRPHRRVHGSGQSHRGCEGATCLIECNVSGAGDDEDARVIARSVICSSPAAKAAIFGHDPNWGRLAAAARLRRAGEESIQPRQSQALSRSSPTHEQGPTSRFSTPPPVDTSRKSPTSTASASSTSPSATPGAGQAWMRSELQIRRNQRRIHDVSKVFHSTRRAPCNADAPPPTRLSVPIVIVPAQRDARLVVPRARAPWDVAPERPSPFTASDVSLRTRRATIGRPPRDAPPAARSSRCPCSSGVRGARARGASVRVR